MVTTVTGYRVGSGGREGTAPARHADPTVAIALEGLAKSYGDVHALDSLSLDIHEGEILGLLGPNGAGKTTTVNIVCGLLRADAGEVTFAPRPATNDLPAHPPVLGLCPQDLVIWEALTCLEQLEFVGRMYDVARPLHDRRHRLAKTLSGGMKRRLNLALALVHRPDTLVLDEPQAGLDPQSRVLVREYIRSLAPPTTVILTTHDMDEADRLADRVAIIDHGTLLVVDTPERLKNSVGEGDVLEVAVPEDAAIKVPLLESRLPEGVRSLACRGGTLRLVGPDVLNLLPRVLERCREIGLPSGEMVIRRRSLEDVFITLTGRELRE
jgi:ABC-2 type transport system ATP-binding protein